MSYDASDMAGDLQAMLEEKGYRFTNPEGGEDDRWSFGGHQAVASSAGLPFSTCNATFIDALKDHCDRSDELMAAAQGVLDAWEKGDLAAATRLLQEAVDAMKPERVTA